MIKKLMDFSDAQILSKEEQKKLKGGYSITCTTSEGYHMESPGSCTGAGATKSACQKLADRWCDEAAGCESCSVH